MDPILAKRLAQQQEKESALESGTFQGVIDVGSAADKSVKVDPVLAKRWEAQQRKIETGDSATVDNLGSVADKTVQLDPVLARRWSQQQEKMNTGKGIDDVGSAAEKATKLDPVLERRLKMQQDKEATGRNSIEDKAVASKAQRSGAAPELQKQLYARRQKCEPVAAKILDSVSTSFMLSRQILYKIEVTSSMGTTVVERRYRDFKKLFDSLSSDFSGATKMPPKSFWRKSFSANFCNQRENCLAEILAMACEADPTASRADFAQFLGLELEGLKKKPAK